VSKWSNSAGNFSWAFLLNADGTLAFWYSTDGTAIHEINSTVPLPWPGGRVSLKATFAHSTGVVSFSWATSIGGTYTQLGPGLTFGAGTLFAGTGSVKVGGLSTYFSGLTGTIGTFGATGGKAFAPNAFNGVNGKIYEAQIRSVIGGTLVADPVFSSQTPGAGSFTDAQSNTWTLNGTAALSNRKFRFHGEAGQWPPRWDPSGKDVYIDFQANGLLRRLQQKNAPVSSAMTRAWQRVTGIYAPVAYWPCEDGNGPTGTTTSSVSATPTQIASGLANGKPMNLGGKQTSFASNTDFLCSDALPVPNKGTWRGAIPAYASPASGAANVARFLLSIPSGGETDAAILARLHTRGTCSQLDLVYHSAGALQLIAYSSSGAVLADTGSVAFAQNGIPCLCEMALTASGGTITAHINTLDAGATSQAGFTDTFSGSIGVATSFIAAPTSANVQSAIGQIAIQSSYANMDTGSADSLIGPLNAWASEAAGIRFARLCAEEGFASRLKGYPATTVVMGAQGIDTFMNLLQECEAADHGMIYEPREALALGYRSSGSMCNQGLATAGTRPVSLSYTAAHLGGGGGMAMQPTDDDMLTLNDETVTRGSSTYTGSSYEAVATGAQFAASAALSTAAPPLGVGSYQDARTVNVWNDWQLPDQAGWIVHLGTVPELRYPSIPVDLARSALSALSAALQDLDLGDYLQVTSPPAWLSADAIGAVAWGLTETLGGYIYTIACQTEPESPYETLVAGTGALADCRADTDGSSLHASITSGATSMGADTTSGFPLWTTTAGDLPFDIIMGGERITVTAISGTSGTQTFTITRSVNGVVKAHTAGEAISLFAPCYLALA
jgi:hypothetical protein